MRITNNLPLDIQKVFSGKDLEKDKVPLMVCCTNVNMISHCHRKILEKKVTGKLSAELMSFCHFRHAGQASTCEGMSLRNRNELDRIHRNASPRGL